MFDEIKGGGGVFWVGHFQTQAKIASLAKLTYPAFKRLYIQNLPLYVALDKASSK